MRITDARDASIVPLHDFIQQAHQIGVGDQGADFRFVDREVVKHSRLLHVATFCSYS
jgi:hypothetical protein